MTGAAADRSRPEPAGSTASGRAAEPGVGDATGAEPGTSGTNPSPALRASEFAETDEAGHVFKIGTKGCDMGC